ncbi:MAG: hypothetical protein ABIH25_04655 [Candidatus Woesearchaeota archaeon]
MLELKKSFKNIQDNEKFIEWKKEHFGSYLTNAFLNDNEWQFDFLDPKSEMMTSFKFNDKDLFFEESEIFRKEKKEIKELNLEEVKIDLDKAEDLIEKIIDSDYKNEDIQKKIIILQVIEKLVWNITYITKSFNVLNVKLNAVNGEIINHSMESLLNFKS